MGQETPREITVESLRAFADAKYQEILATREITKDFKGLPQQYQEKAREERRAREKIEDELLEMAARALPVLGYDVVMKIVEEGTHLWQHHDILRLYRKILRYVTENMLQKPKAEPVVQDPLGTGQQALDVLKKKS